MSLTFVEWCQDELWGVDLQKLLHDRDKVFKPWSGDPLMQAARCLELSISLSAVGREQIASPATRCLRAFITLAHSVAFASLLACTPAHGKFSEVKKIRCIHNQGYSLMPLVDGNGLEETAQMTEGAVKGYRQSTKLCGSSSRSALDVQHVQNAAIVHSMTDHHRKSGPRASWPQVLIFRWCCVFMHKGSHAAFHGTHEQLDLEAQGHIFINPERKGMLFVSTDEQVARAKDDLSWDGQDVVGAEEICFCKHRSNPDHDYCGDETCGRDLTVSTYLKPPFGFPVAKPNELRKQLLDLRLISEGGRSSSVQCACVGVKGATAVMALERDRVRAQAWFGSAVMQWYSETKTTVPDAVCRVRKAYEKTASILGLDHLPDAACVDMEEDEEDSEFRIAPGATAGGKKRKKTGKKTEEAVVAAGAPAVSDAAAEAPKKKKKANKALREPRAIKSSKPELSVGAPRLQQLLALRPAARELEVGHRRGLGGERVGLVRKPADEQLHEALTVAAAASSGWPAREWLAGTVSGPRPPPRARGRADPRASG